MEITPGVANNRAPATLHRQLESIQLTSAGGAYLGTSSLTGRLWKGSLWYFDDPHKAVDGQSSKSGIDLEAGTADLQLITDEKIVIASDSGALQVWELTPDNGFVQLYSEQGHDDVMTSVSVCCNKTRVVSGSYDCRVKVWDLTDGLATHNLKGHYDIVNSVAFHPTQPDVFASCSQDGTLLVWDLRKSYPAQKLDISALKSTPTCIIWSGGPDMTLALGTESGAIAVLSCEDSKQISVCKTHDAALNRIVIHPEKKNWIASTSYDSSVAVTNCQGNDSQVIYRDKRHEDFSRGISWQYSSDTLFSCGWDKQVLSHRIVTNMEQNGHEIDVSDAS